MTDFKAKPPVGIDPIGASSEGASVYELIREDIIEGRLKPNERLVVADLAQPSRHVHESRSRGAATAPGRGLRHLRPQPRRARPADRPGFRPRHLRDRRADRAGPDPLVRRHGDRTRTSPSSSASRRLIEENNFADPLRHSELDTAFHTVMYQRHYNRHAAELWWKHREVLRAVSRRFNFTLARRAPGASASIANSSSSSRPATPTRRPKLIARHVEGSGRHILEQMRAPTPRRPASSTGARAVPSN